MGCKKCKCGKKEIEPCEINLPTITKDEIIKGMNGENRWIESMEQSSNSIDKITINSRLYQII